MLDGARHLLKPTRRREQVHLIVPLADLVGKAACPGLDLVELEFLLVVSGLADIDGLVRRETAGPTLGIPCDEHDEAAIIDFFNSMVSILPSLDDLVFEEILLKAMNCLLGAVVPARIYPCVARAVLPRPIYLGHNGLPRVVRVGDMDPIT